MLLAIDAGNTNIVFAVYDGARCVGSWRCRTEASRTADEYAAFLSQLFQGCGLSFGQITGIIVSSVVPDANFHLRQFFKAAFSCQPRFVGNDDLKPEIKVMSNQPEQVGADRLVNAVAVVSHYSYPAVVVDFGTATTFDVVGADGAFHGGVIAPGVNLSMDALHRAAAKLPKVSVKKPPSVICRDTVGAMQSGIYWGYVSLIEGMIARIGAELGTKPYVIGTGGLSPLFAEGTDAIDCIDADLTLKGLLAIHQQSKKKATTP